MNFDFTEEQTLLKDMVERFVAERCTPELRRAVQKSPEGWSRALWKEMAELGLLGVNVPEDDGGLGGGAVETKVVMEALGKGLVVEPYLASAVVATVLLRHCPAGAARSRLLGALAAGEDILAPALYERRGRFDLDHVGTSAVRRGADHVLNGEKSAVIGGGIASGFLVSARVGAGADAAGIGLFHVPRDAKGVTVVAARAIDNSSIATLLLDDVALSPEHALAPSHALPIIERGVDAGIAALAAEAVGVIRASIDLTADYLRTRQQFGRPIGQFQVLSHACVDMFVQGEEASSASILAAGRCDSSDARTRRRAISAAKVTANKACRFVGQTAIQLHGGIGMTEEYAIGHYFKRLTTIEQTFGDTDHHVGLFAAA